MERSTAEANGGLSRSTTFDSGRRLVPAPIHSAAGNAAGIDADSESGNPVDARGKIETDIADEGVRPPPDGIRQSGPEGC